MVETPPSNAPATRKPRWYAPTPAKFLFAALVMQGVLFLSAHYRWFWFNERKGWTVLITVATTAVLLLLLIAGVIVSRFFKSKSQLGLATLLLMVPVMAIPCGWLAREMELARQQRDLVKWANSVVTDPKRLSENWVTELLGVDFFRDVTVLRCPKDSITDAHLVKFKGLIRLQGLYLKGTQVADAGLDRLKGLTQLQMLDLDETLITDGGLVHLEGLKRLKNLTLIETQGTDAGLERLRGLTELRILNLNGTKVTDAGLEHLKSLTELRQLHLEETAVTVDGIDRLQVALPYCTVLHSLPRPQETGGDSSETKDVTEITSHTKWVVRCLEHRGGVLRVMLPEAPSAAHLPLMVTLKNSGEKLVECGATGYFLDCVITIQSKDGKPVAYTGMGRSLFAEGTRVHTQYSFVTLKRGEHHTWNYDLSDAFVPLEPREYSLTLEAHIVFLGVDKKGFATKEGTEGARFVAKEITFTVTSKQTEDDKQE